MKRFICIALVAIIAISLLAVTAFAASSVNADEQRTLDAAGETVTVAGKDYKLDAAWLNECKNYFLKDDVDLTAAQADEIIGYIKQVQDLVKTSPYVKDLRFTPEINKQAFALINKAAAVNGVTFTYSNGTFTVTDASGAVIFTTTATIKPTGANGFVLPAVVLASLLVVAGAGAFCVKKFAL